MTADPLSQLEAQLRLADAAGKAPSYADLADMVRSVRESAEPQAPDPVVCCTCDGTGTVGILRGDVQICPHCEGTGMHTIPQDQDQPSP